MTVHPTVPVYKKNSSNEKERPKNSALQKSKKVQRHLKQSLSDTIFVIQLKLEDLNQGLGLCAHSVLHRQLANQQLAEPLMAPDVSI